VRFFKNSAFDFVRFNRLARSSTASAGRKSLKTLRSSLMRASTSGGNVIVFPINQATGELTSTEASVQVPTPMGV